jgi:hypothetical protein
MQRVPSNMRTAAHTRQQLYSCPVCRGWSRMQQSYSRRQQRCTASASDPPPPNRNRKPQMSRVEAFMRSTPGLNRFVDGTLLAGDVVMVLATQVGTAAAGVDELLATCTVVVPQLAAWRGRRCQERCAVCRASAAAAACKQPVLDSCQQRVPESRGRGRWQEAEADAMQPTC